MRVKWLELALDDLDAVIEYIAKENTLAAQQLAERIYKSGLSLGDNPEMGRPGRIQNSREWVVTNTSYLLAYRIRDKQVEIMRVLHGRQSWPTAFT